MTKSRGILTARKKWSTDETLLLAHLYACTYTATLAKLFNCKIEQVYQRANTTGLSKSDWYKNSPMAQRLRTDCSMGIPYRFKKGQTPPNKGLKGISYPGSVPTQFKPGSKPPNHKPVGTIRVVDGYFEIKMAEGMRQWKLLHRVIWERMNGKIPDGYLVTFIDGDQTNIEITNLTLMTKQENARRNSIHRYGPEIAKLYQLKGAINRQINKRERNQHE
jgi:hypothetical protein